MVQNLGPSEKKSIRDGRQPDSWERACSRRQGKEWPAASAQMAGEGVRGRDAGELLRGSQGDLGENHFTGRCGWKLILGMTKELRRQPTLGHTSEAWL